MWEQQMIFSINKFIAEFYNDYYSVKIMNDIKKKDERIKLIDEPLSAEEISRYKSATSANKIAELLKSIRSEREKLKKEEKIKEISNFDNK